MVKIPSMQDVRRFRPGTSSESSTINFLCAENAKTERGKSTQTTVFHTPKLPPMSPSENQVAAIDPSAEYKVEFRAYYDDAWYSVRVLLERGEALRIKYLNFGDDNDSLFQANNFKSLKELEEFQKRFRPASDQLQDNECRSVVPGATVCACHWFSNGEVRFYDAVVDGVQENEHSFEKGEEECLCIFSLLWLHGPIAGTLTTTAIANICKIQPTLELDPALSSFLKLARERTEVTSSNSSSFSKGVGGWEVVAYCDESPITTHRLGFFERLQKETRCARRSASKTSPLEEMIVNYHGRRLEDRDLGGMKNHCMILIGNLDKALSPQTIAEFLHRETSVLPRVYIYPSLSSELFTKGAIIFDCERDFQKLCDFLNNPKQIIISSTGRPWVIIEKLVGLKNIKASIGTLTPLSEAYSCATIVTLEGKKRGRRHSLCQKIDKNNILQKGNSGRSNHLRIVYSSTQDFKIASDLRDLFVAFSAHQQLLHKRLAFEEGSILFSNPI